MIGDGIGGFVEVVQDYLLQIALCIVGIFFVIGVGVVFVEGLLFYKAMLLVISIFNFSCPFFFGVVIYLAGDVTIGVVLYYVYGVFIFVIFVYAEPSVGAIGGVYCFFDGFYLAFEVVSLQELKEPAPRISASTEKMCFIKKVMLILQQR